MQGFGSFNMTFDVNTNRLERRFLINPFVFSGVKVVLAYGMYGLPTTNAGFDDGCRFPCERGLGWYLYCRPIIGAVRDNAPGDHHGPQIGAVVGILVSLCDAPLVCWIRDVG